MSQPQRNPYRNLPDHAFWRRAVAALPPDVVDPVTSVPFTIAPADAVATAGSCFAQYIATSLSEQGFNYLITEPAPLSADAADENYGVYPARFGNVYTTRQLLQLLDRAYGRFAPEDQVWQRADGGFLDPFRPHIQGSGFATPEALHNDRAAHLAAVRRMFESCRVFIFTLGLTECWLAASDGAAVPVAPGAAGAVAAAEYSFHNLTVAEIDADLMAFIDRLREVNPCARLILTVSPVPLIATYEDRHVLVSTIYSKSALRVVAEMAVQQRNDVAYFPAYEIVTGHHNRYRFFADDLRTVTAEGVAHVMAIFARHYLSGDMPGGDREDLSDLFALQAIICEEEAIDR